MLFTQAQFSKHGFLLLMQIGVKTDEFIPTVIRYGTITQQAFVLSKADDAVLQNMVSSSKIAILLYQYWKQVR